MLLPSVLRSPPIFAQPKSEKRLQREESPTETLATHAKAAFNRVNTVLQVIDDWNFPSS